jgi:hypothetical protein
MCLFTVELKRLIKESVHREIDFNDSLPDADFGKFTFTDNCQEVAIYKATDFMGFCKIKAKGEFVVEMEVDAGGISNGYFYPEVTCPDCKKSRHDECVDFRIISAYLIISEDFLYPEKYGERVHITKDRKFMRELKQELEKRFAYDHAYPGNQENGKYCLSCSCKREKRDEDESRIRKTSIFEYRYNNKIEKFIVKYEIEDDFFPEVFVVKVKKQGSDEIIPDDLFKDISRSFVAKLKTIAPNIDV